MASRMVIPRTCAYSELYAVVNCLRLLLDWPAPTSLRVVLNGDVFSFVSCYTSLVPAFKDDWDDDDMDDDFCNQLRAELEKTRSGAAASSGQAKP